MEIAAAFTTQENTGINDVLESMDNHNAYKPQFTVIENSNGTLNKTISLKNGKLDKSSNANMYQGNAKTFDASDFAQFEKIINSLTPYQAITLGITSFPEVEINPDDFRRTKDNFHFREKPTLFYIDIDGSDFGVDETIALFYQALPEFENKTYYKRVSSSGNIKGYEKDNYHLWFLADDGSHIPELKKIIQSRLWHSGLGKIKVSSSGQQLVRNTLGIDDAVFSPERLVFEANPTLEDGLELNEARNCIVRGSDDIVKISTLEFIDYKHLVTQLKQAGIGEVDKKIELNPVYKDLSKNEKNAIRRGVIPQNLMLHFDNGLAVKAKDLDASFDELLLVDPFDDKHRVGKAKFYWNNGNKKLIHSIRTDTNYAIEDIDIRKGIIVDGESIVRRDLEYSKQWISDEIKQFLKDDTFLLVLKADAGLGKTSCCVDAVIESESNPNIHLFVKNHALAREFKQKYINEIEIAVGSETEGESFKTRSQRDNKRFLLKDRILVMKGRYQTKNGEYDESASMCKHPLLKQNYGNTFDAFSSKLCKACSIYPCGYRDQFKERAFLKIWQHQHLFSGKSYLEDDAEGSPNSKQRENKIVIIDESCFDNLAKATRISYFSASAGIKKIIDTNNISRDLIKDEFKALKKINDEIQNTDAGNIDSGIKLLSPEEKNHLKFYEQLNLGRYDQFKISLNNNKDKSELILCEIEQLQERFRDVNKVLILDATSKKEFYDLVLHKPFKFKELKVKFQDNIKIIQHAQRTYSKNYILNNKKQIADEIGSKIEELQKNGKKVGLITYRKLLINNHKKESEYIEALTKADVTGYFFNIRGSNSFEDVDYLIILGRPSIGGSIEEVGRSFNIIDDYSEVNGTALIEMKESGKFLKVNKKKFINPKMNVLYNQYSYAELSQVISRIRPLHGNATKTVEIYSNEPHDCIISEVVYDELKDDLITNKIIYYIIENGCISTKPSIIAKLIDEKVDTIKQYKNNSEDAKEFPLQQVLVKRKNRNKLTLEFWTNDGYVIKQKDIPDDYTL